MSTTNQEHWEALYGEGRSRWSGRPNASLVEQVRDLTPSTALDLGCGLGADAIWLASQGWTVTAVDIAAAALELAEADGLAAGVGHAITWERRDLATGELPAGPFHLVTASFLHSPVAIPRTEILRRAAEVVAPGGTLLVISHAPAPAHDHADLQPVADVAAALALDPQVWETITQEDVARTHTLRDEDAPHERIDAVLALRRRP